jgi:ABC-type multidrug transport system ATPase subunit
MLAIRDLVKVYPGPVSALQGVDLDVPKGMFGLLGPNGAGKTTLMRIVAGLLEPTSGTVTLDGVDVVADPAAVWKNLGYLPQEFGFYPHLTGAAMLAYLLKLKGIEPAAGTSTKKLCRELLDRVNLSFAARRKLKGYSGGMKQRLGIAQAIAGDPPDSTQRSGCASTGFSPSSPKTGSSCCRRTSSRTWRFSAGASPSSATGGSSP